MQKRSKQMIALLLAALLLVASAPAAGLLGVADFLSVTAAAETYSGPCGVDGSNVVWMLDTNTAVLTIKGSGAMEEYAGSHWTKDTPWADYASLITTVVIENGVTSIGAGSFFYNPNLSSVTIGNSVSLIGARAFEGCGALSTVTIPDNVKGIADRAFADCTLLSRATIGNGVTSIGADAFTGCANLASVLIGNRVTSIGKRAFYYCTGLPKVTIPDSVTSIGEQAFYSCTGLAKVTLGSGVISIGKEAFIYCSALANIHIPAGVEGIGENAFTDCGSLFYICSDTEDCYAKTYAQQNHITFKLCDEHVTTCAHKNIKTVKENETPATCTTAGKFDEVVYCTDCGSELSRKTLTVAALGHSFTNYVYNNDATTEKDGTKTAKCDRCDATDTIPAPGTKTGPKVAIKNYTANKTIDYRATITFTADVQNAVSGGAVHWFVNGKDAATSETYTVTEATESFTVQAKYVKDGTVLAESETENVTVKAGFFAKLVAFFRALFKRLPKQTQEAFDAVLFTNLLP